MKYYILLVMGLFFCLSANAQVKTNKNKAFTDQKDSVSVAKTNELQKKKHWTKVQQTLNISKDQCDQLKAIEDAFRNSNYESNLDKQRKLEKDRDVSVYRVLKNKQSIASYKRMNRQFKALNN